MRKQVGDYGENLSLDFLKKKGHRIVECNYRCPVGEVDIISLYEDVYRFNEVKTAFRGGFNPLEQITPKKINKLSKIATWYMKEHRKSNLSWSIDAIGIIISRGEKPTFFYEENITL